MRRRSEGAAQCFNSMLRWPDVIMKHSIVSPQVIRDFNVGISPTHICTQVLFLGCTEWTNQISGQQPFRDRKSVV